MPSVGSTPTTTSPAPQPLTIQTSALTPVPAIATATTTVAVIATAPAPVAKRRQIPARITPQLPQTPEQQLQLQRQIPARISPQLPQPPEPQQQQQQQLQRPRPRLQPMQLPALPLQLQYQHYQPQQTAPVVTTTQPTPAGVFTHNNNNQSYVMNNNNNSRCSNSSNGNSHNGNSNSNNNNNDMSPVSISNSFSSADTNQTLLNSIANQQRSAQHQQQQHSAARPQSHSRKYSQFMIITPAVSIDRDFEYETHLDFEDFANAAHNNGNLFRAGLRRSDSSSDDSGHSSDSSFRSNYNPYLHHSRQHLLSSNKNGTGGGRGAHRFYAFSSWRWCTLLCAAMRCFGAGGHSGNQAPFSSSFVQHRLLRRCSSYNADTAYDYEHFAAPFKPRKTRDHLNNITYEL